MDQRDSSTLGVRQVTPHRNNGAVTRCLRLHKYSDTDQRPCARYPALYRISDNVACRTYGGDSKAPLVPMDLPLVARCFQLVRSTVITS